MANADKLYEIQQHLFGRNRDKIVPGLQRISAAARECGNPQFTYNVVHIAGTNGKGSTASMIANGLISAGEKVGLFTSPHIFSFGERFSINGEIAPAKKWLEIYQEIEEICERFELTFFEIATLIAFELFRREKCSWVVLETGMGGRLDSTNICIPKVSVITTIGIDHTAFLGNTIEEIANEKLGIVKHSIPLVISGINLPQILEQAQNFCNQINSPCFVTDLNRVKNIVNSENPPEICLDLEHIFKFSMDGEFQKINFLTAITVLEKLGFCGEKKIFEAVAKTVVPARMQRFTLNGKTLIFDVAHNPQAIEHLAKSLEKMNDKTPISAIFGMMSDKAIKETIKFIAPIVENVFCFTPATKRAELADYLAEDFRECGAKNVFVCKSAKEAFEKAYSMGETILVSGSFFVVSEVMKAANIDFYL
jgi:dihydrofolate synthase/folylpolyglutamate synthase